MSVGGSGGIGSRYRRHPLMDEEDAGNPRHKLWTL